MLLPESDPRVQAVLKAYPYSSREFRRVFHTDWRDAAEIVNAVLAADDSFDHSARASCAPQSIPDTL